MDQCPRRLTPNWRWKHSAVAGLAADESILRNRRRAQGVEAMGIEPTNLLHAMQALYQLSYAPEGKDRG